MQQLKVSVVTLTSGTRPAMLARAIHCVAASTYPEIEHIVFDAAPYVGRTIGYIRNIANSCASGELIAHADDDDVSHPRRLAEQVALLQASGKQCVGFRELLFWDTREHSEGEAWLYRGQDPRWCAGASMLYTREAWEACPFDDAQHEDQRWWLKNAEKCVGGSSIAVDGHFVNDPKKTAIWMPTEPRMVCQMHAGGTEQIAREVMLRGDVWSRTPEYDQFCERTMNL